MTFRSPAESTHPKSPANAALIDAIQKHLLDRVAPALDRALADVDDYLFDRSQNGESKLGMMALREMRHARADVVNNYKLTITRRFRALRDQQGPLQGGEDAGLSLLSEQALEEQLAVEQLASTVLRAHASLFEVTSKRFFVVVGQGELRSRENPLDPVFLATALGNAMSQLELDDDLRIVIFKYFEREVSNVVGDLYERCNTLLLSAGILPDLRASAGAKPVHVRAPATHDEAGSYAGMPPQHAPPPQQQPAAASYLGETPSAADQAMFTSMLGQLAAWRNTAGVQPSAAQGPTLGTHDLLSILSLMQHDAAPAISPDVESAQTLAAQLRERMLQSAHKLGVPGDNLHLDGLDNDAVDLVALLFDVLLDGPQYDSQIRGMIGRMLVPYVKVAVKDRRMFMLKEHPARKLLNTVAEACEGNRGEAPQERAILTRVDHTIDRLVAEFNEDVAIFETLEQELRAFLAQQRKRFELAEKRTTEAQRGRERLDHARSAVTEDVAAHRGARELPPVLDDFISHHATHHLVQITLRDGKGSPRYNTAMQAVDDVLAAFDLASAGQLPHFATALPSAVLSDIFASAGCSGEAAIAAEDALRDALTRLANGEAAQVADVRLPAQIDVLDPELTPQEAQLEVVADNAALDFDAAMLERIRKLKIGDWLQLAGADGHFAPAKVSWISPISARLLLVNRRGIRVLVASAQELAVMAKLDRVIVREGSNAFDEAMHLMAGRLQSAAESA
ncbi:MAG: DUF1631 domain-containing protein [Thermomonas sp.]|uniref:DUF1631 family protein n=1 Tax=Thermomonas sp. TaxID=1971895 RepID=UPI001ED10970|nr:DUF1631 family protein [Thermomonas sp.]MBV2210301.1 DUF1631 domain-containing protein [Thermomonas sp.]